MSIGATLAKARRDSGLTVTQVSERTRIRETIIRGIEQDDYSACGGDFYARGHVRSIARVVGADPAPLIGEYDATLRAPEEITAAQALEPSLPIMRGGGSRLNRTGSGPRLNWTTILALALVAVVGVIGYLLVSGPSAGPTAATGLRPAHHRAGHAAAHPRPTPTRSARRRSALAARHRATTRRTRRWRSPATRPRPGTPAGTPPPGSATCRRAPACSWTWVGR
jgi:hypothetical protein